MATPRKSPKPLVIEVVGSGPALADAVAQMASTPGTHVMQLSLDGATMKAVTDRVRRIPRQRGLNALTVKVREAGDGSYLLDVTNTGTKATPWPKPAAKAPAKAAAKQRSAAKAPSPEAVAAKSAPSGKLAPRTRRQRRDAATKAAAK